MADIFLEKLEARRLLSTVSPVLAMELAARTSDSTPRITVSAHDGSGFDSQGLIQFDLDLNNDGDFDDPGEQAFASVNPQPTVALEQQSKLLPSDGIATNDQFEFGSSVAISGNTAVVGRARSNSSSTQHGSVYIFEFDGQSWNETARIPSPLTGGFDSQFGESVALNGDLLVVGSRLADTDTVHAGGVAYVYERQAGDFVLVKRLESSDQAGGEFGSHIATDGQTIVIGAPFVDEGNNSERGRAYVFEKVDGQWTETSILQPLAFHPQRTFAASVSVSGSTIAVGETGRDTTIDIDAGAVHLFERVNDTWTHDVTLHVKEVLVGTGNNFGHRIAIDGDTLAVRSNVDERNKGQLYVFERTNGIWDEVSEFRQGEFFADAVVLSGDIIVTRGERTPNGRTPIAVYQRIDGHWYDAGSYFATDDGRDYFGEALAFDGTTILASAPKFGGSVYSFTLEPQQTIQDIVATLELPELQIGDYQIRARVQDAAGLESITDSQPLTIVQSSAPRVEVTLPEINGDPLPIQFTSDSTPPVSVVAHDANGLVSGDSVFIDIDLNGDGDFEDLGESAFAQGLLSGLSTYNQTGKFQPGELYGSDEFGLAVAIDGNRAVVGAPYDDDAGEDVGAVYVFDFNGSIWNQTAKVTLSNADRELFGSAVAIDGDRLLISAEEDGTAAPFNGDTVYVFEFDGSSWNQTDEISSPGQRGDEFGHAIALEGDRAVIAAPEILSDTAIVYVYEKVGGQWVVTQQLEPSDGPAGTEFGFDVDLDGNMIIVGVRRTSFATDETGRAYIFEFDGNSWTETARLQSTLPREGDDFGLSVAIEGDVALVGAPSADGSGLVGLAFVFEKIDGTWELAGRLRSNPSSFNQFGYSVAIDNGLLLVGARRGDTDVVDDGTAFVYQKVGEHWVEIAEIQGENADAAESFGTAVGISDGRIVVTSNPRHDLSDQGGSSGAAYFFEPSLVGPVNETAATAIDLPQLSDGLYSLRARVSDANGNTATTQLQQITVQQANISPSLVSATPVDSTQITGSRLELQLEFSEPVMGFKASDIVVSGSASGQASVDAPHFEGGHIWSISIGELVDGDLKITIAPDAGDITDVSGLSVATTVLDYVVVVDPPSVASISHDVEKVIDRSYFDLYVDFDQQINSNGNLDLQISGVASTNADADTASGDVDQRGIEITDLVSGDLELILAPVPGGIFNVAGKDLSPVTLNMSVEIGPTIVSRTPDSGVITSSSMLIDVVLSEPVLGVDATDLRLYGDAAANASVGTPIDLGQNSWRFSVTGLTDGDLTVGLGMDRGDITDIEGHSLQPNSWSYTIDATRPIVTGQSLPAGSTITDAVQAITFFFSEPITNVDDSDIVITGSAFQFGSTNRTSSSQSSTRWVLRHLNSGDLHITVAPDPGDIVDLNGQSAVPSTWSYTVDLGDQPFVVTTQNSTRGSQTNIDVLFSEPVFGVDASDLVLENTGGRNAVVGTPFMLSENVWRFPVTNLEFGRVTVFLASDAGDIVDADGNSVPLEGWSFDARDEAIAFDVYGNNRLIFDDSMNASFLYGTDFGTTQAGNNGPIKSFQIVNTGSEDLVLGALTVPDGFVVIDDLDLTLSPGGETSFALQLDSLSASASDPSSIGLFQGDVGFLSNHPIFSPFDMEVSGFISVPTLVVESAMVNNDSDQRSMVNALSFGFSGDVSNSLTVDAISVENLTMGSFIDVANMQLNYDPATNTATWTFPGLVGGTLQDGNFLVTLDSTEVVDSMGNMLNVNLSMNLHRFYGDKDGDRDVDSADLFKFRSSLFLHNQNAGYDQDFDHDSDGDVDSSDLFQFRSNLFQQLPEPQPLQFQQQDADMMALLMSLQRTANDDNSTKTDEAKPWTEDDNLAGLWNFEI